MENSIASRIWFEARLGGASKSYFTVEEAHADIKNASNGYPEDKVMSDENRAYWMRVAKDMVVVKVTQTEEILTY